MPKNPYRLTIYVPDEAKEKVKTFIKHVKARNESASGKIVGWITNFVDNNIQVNPQTRMTPYLSQQTLTCAFCQNPVTHLGFTSKNQVPLCQEHALTKKTLFHGIRKLEK